MYCAVAVPYRSDYVAVTADPSLEAVLFDFSHTLFRPEERTQWVRRAGELAGANLAEDEAGRLAGEIERLLVWPMRARSGRWAAICRRRPTEQRSAAC